MKREGRFLEEPEEGLEIAPEEERGERRRKKRIRSVFLKYVNRIRPIGFKGVGIVDVVQFFIDGLRNRSFALYAAAMSFRFMFALFPGLIFLLTLVPLIPIPGLEGQVLDYMGTLIPGEAMDIVNQVIDEVFHKSKFGVLSFNLVIMVTSALGGVRAMMFAFSRSDSSLFKRRNILQVNLVAIYLLVVLVVVFFLILGTWIYGDILINGWEKDGVITSQFALFMLQLGHWLLMLLLFFFGISFLYYVAPETHTKMAFFSPGSILASVLSLFAVWGLKVILAGFVSFSKFYGSLSAIMVLMFWFYWISIVLLIGFEFNLSVRKAKMKANRDKSEIDPGTSFLDLTDFI